MPVSERVIEQKILIAVDFGMYGDVKMIDPTHSAHLLLGTTFSSVLWRQTGEVKS